MAEITFVCNKYNNGWFTITHVGTGRVIDFNIKLRVVFVDKIYCSKLTSIIKEETILGFFLDDVSDFCNRQKYGY